MHCKRQGVYIPKVSVLVMVYHVLPATHTTGYESRERIDETLHKFPYSASFNGDDPMRLLAGLPQ